MNKDDFMRYLEENFNLTGAHERMILNVLGYAEGIANEAERHRFLCDMFDNTIGLSEKEIRMIEL